MLTTLGWVNWKQDDQEILEISGRGELELFTGKKVRINSLTASSY